MATSKPRTKRKGTSAPTVGMPAISEEPKKKMAKGWVELDSDDFDESNIDPRLRNQGYEDLPRTRPGNSQKQPGMVDVSPARIRRTAAEVAKAKLDRAEQSKKDHEALLQKRKAVAELEDAMAINEEARQVSAAKPAHGPVTTKVPRPVAQDHISEGSKTVIEADEDIVINDINENEDSDDYDGVASSPLKSRRVVKPKKKRGDDRALIEHGRLVESKMGDLFASATSDTSKRKLVNQDAHPQPVAKKSKPALPSGLLPDASVSRVNLTTQFAKSTKVSTTRTSTPADDLNFSSRYGGILDSDLDESSPPMVMAKTATKKSIAKINRGAPAVKLEAMETPVGGRPRAIRRKEIYNQTHLPPGTLALWKSHLIPAWRDLAGTRVNAWHTTLPELCDELKEIWDIIYPSRTQEIIEVDGPIFGVAIQRWYEWRANIGRAVLLFVDEYMKNYSNDADARAVHATFMKGDTVKIPFAWKDHPLSIEDPQVFTGLFLSDFVLEGLAAHFNMTSTVCPELQVDNEPCGALAIATVAAERAFTFWATGHSTADDEKRKEEAKFSEDNWGPSTLSYITSVSNLKPRKWAKIKEAACERMTASKSALTLHQAHATTTSDARGSLFEEDSEPE